MADAERSADILLNVLLGQASLDGTLGGLDQLDAALSKVGANASLQQQIDDLKEMSASIDNALDPYLTLVNQVGDSWATADERLKQYMADIETVTSADMTGAGAFGGGDDGGGGGSLFGVARGLRAGAGIGRIAGVGGATTTAFTGAADVLYLEQAFSKLQDVLPGLVESVTAASPAAADLAAGLTAMGVPAAGLLAVLGPLAIAVAAVGAAVVVWNAEMDTSKKLLDAVVESQNAQIKVALSGKTTDQIEQENAVMNNGIAIRQKVINQDKAALQSGEDQALKINAAAAAIYDLSPAAGALRDEINKLSDANTKAAADVNGNTQAINNGATAAADAAEAKKIHDQQLGDAADKAIALRKEEVTDLQGTSTSIQKRLDALTAEREGVEQAIAIYEKSGDTSDAARKKENDLNDSLDVLDHRIFNINQGLPDIIAGEDAAKAAKEADKEFAESLKDTEQALKSIIDANNNYDKAIQTARENLANAINDSRIKELTSEQQYMAGSTQDTFARGSIALKEQRDIAKIEEDTSDKITDIRTKLGETEAKDALDLARQLEDGRIAEQNQEAIDLIDHNSRLAAIRQSSYDNELDDVANRDFAKLARDERTAGEKIPQEDTSYGLTEEKQRIHLAQQEAQQTKAEERKIADAEIAAENAIAQAQTTEQRKIEAAKDGEQQQLDDLTRNEQEKLTLLRQSWYNQYEMLVVQENQREQLAAQTEQQIVSAAENILGQGVQSIISQGQSALHNVWSSVGAGGGTTSPASQYQALNPPDGAGSYGNFGGDLGSTVNNAVSAIGGGVANFLQGLLAS